MNFFGKDSEIMKSKVSSLCKNFFPHLDLKIILVNKFTIGSLFRYKDRLPPMLRSGLVYKYSCKVPCTSSYVGCTSRRLQARQAEHRGFSERTGARLTAPPQSNIRSHCENTSMCCGPVRSDNFKILGYEGDFTKLRILESLHIDNCSPNLNDRLSSYPLKLR